jgi:hypothetical protein
MFNISKSKFCIALFIAFVLTSCTNDKNLPPEVINEIQEAIGEDRDFANVRLLNFDDLESVTLVRSETLEDGSPKYETKSVTSSVKNVKKVLGVSNHSVHVAIMSEMNDPNDPPHCNDIGNSICNIITINNEKIMICEKTASKLISSTTDGGAGIPNTMPLSNELAEKLAELGGRKTSSISHLVVNDLKNGETKTLINLDDFEKVNFNLMRDCVGALTHVNSASTIFYKGSCCSTTSSNGDEEEGCNRRC